MHIMIIITAENIEEANAKILYLTTELDMKESLVRQLEAAKMKLHKEVMELSQSRQRIKATEEEHDKEHSKEIEELKKSIRTLTAHRDSKHLLNEKISKQYDEMLKSNEVLRDELAELKRQLTEYKQTIASLTKENTELRATGRVSGESDALMEKLLLEVAALNEELDGALTDKATAEQSYRDKLEDADMQLEYLRKALRDSEEQAQCSLPVDAATMQVMECIKALPSKNRALSDIISRLTRHEGRLSEDDSVGDRSKSPHCTGTSVARLPPPLTILDAIYLLEGGYLTLHCPNECHDNSSDEDDSVDDYFLLHGTHLDGSSVGGQSGRRRRVVSPACNPSVSECTLRLMDFMEQHQILVIASYLCATPLLTAVGGKGLESGEGVVMNIGENPWHRRQLFHADICVMSRRVPYQDSGYHAAQL